MFSRSYTVFIATHYVVSRLPRSRRRATTRRHGTAQHASRSHVFVYKTNLPLAPALEQLQGGRPARRHGCGALGAPAVALLESDVGYRDIAAGAARL